MKLALLRANGESDAFVDGWVVKEEKFDNGVRVRIGKILRS